MTFFHGHKKDQSKKVLVRTTKATTSQFSKQYYRYKHCYNGVFLALHLADLYSDSTIDQIQGIQLQSPLFYRYLGDCLKLFSSKEIILDLYLQLIKTLHHNLRTKLLRTIYLLFRMCG